MKIVIAPDSFKESLSADKVAEAIANGLRAELTDLEIVNLPLADGGEGTTDILVAAKKGEFIECCVQNPLGRSITTRYGIINGDTAIIEMAAAAGLDLLCKSERDPSITTTYGVGEMMMNALERGIKKLIIGLGGSATNDAGAGMLQALGVKLRDSNGRDLSPGGAALVNLASVDASHLDARWAEIEMTIACDVDNPLCGERGASATFGPQKGASPQLVAKLDAALSHFADCCCQWGFLNLQNMAGAGAAGGMGFALLAFFNAQILPGIDVAIDAVGLENELEMADLVITGEGKFDWQTAAGKVAQGVLKLAKQKKVPCIAICGAIEQSLAELDQQEFLAVFPSISALDEWENVRLATADNLQRTARQIARLLKHNWV